MPPIKQKRIDVTLDKVERKKIEQIRQLNREFADLDLGQVAHLALKSWLFDTIKATLNENASKQSGKLLISSRQAAETIIR